MILENNLQMTEIPSVLSNTIRENIRKGFEVQDDNEINEIMKMFGILVSGLTI